MYSSLVWVFKIKQAVSSNPKKSKRPKFATARVVHINQVSKFGKVEVAIDGVAGTRSVNLCTTRWRLPGLVEEGICYINELNEMAMLKEPKSWKEIQRISDKTIRDRWNHGTQTPLPDDHTRLPPVDPHSLGLGFSGAVDPPGPGAPRPSRASPPPCVPRD